MKNILLTLFLTVLLPGSVAHALDKLVLEIDAEVDLLSASHNIDNFPFQPTLNFSRELAGDLSERVRVDALKDHLVISALVRIDGEVAGIATEQEIVKYDPETAKVVAHSAWLFMLNHPKANGFLAVKQQEGNKRVFEMVQEVMQHPEKQYEDKVHFLLSTTSKPVIELAKGDLEGYQGGRFEEYNGVNQAELRDTGRLNARLRFIIFPPGE